MLSESLCANCLLLLVPALRSLGALESAPVRAPTRPAPHCEESDSFDQRHTEQESRSRSFGFTPVEVPGRGCVLALGVPSITIAQPRLAEGSVDDQSGSGLEDTGRASNRHLAIPPLI